MTAMAVGAPRLSVARVMGDTLSVIRRRWTVILPLALLVSFAPNALMAALTLMVARDSLGDAASLEAPANLVGALASCFLTPALILLAGDDFAGRPASLSSSLRKGARFFLPMLGLSIIYGLGVLLGFILLIAPGVIMMLMWAVVGPAMVLEGRGVTGSFDRSAVLTKGHRWAILGLWAIYVVLVFGSALVATLIVGAAAQLGQASGLIVGAISSGATQVLITLVSAVGVTALHHQLRTLKEGGQPDSLASVFD